MAESIKDKAVDAGQKIADTARTVGSKIAEKAEIVGQKVAEGAGKATDWVKEKTHFGDKGTAKASDIREHMEVFGSCGNKLGRVDRVEGNAIKLTKDSSPDGQHHFVPLGSVERVDQAVRLNVSCGEARRAWNTPFAEAGAG